MSVRRVAFARAHRFDVTQAVPRALEALGDSTIEAVVMSWEPDSTEPRRPPRVSVPVEFLTFGSPRPRGRIQTLTKRIGYSAWLARSLHSTRPDVVQAFDLESAATALSATFGPRRRLIYDVRDPFAESYRWPLGVKRLAYLLDWLVMSRCSGFVVPEASRVPYLGRWGRTRPVAVVRNTCADEPPGPLPPSVPPRQSSEVVRIAYLGYLVDSRGGQQLCRVCRAEDGRTELLVAGEIRSPRLESSIASCPHAHDLGRLPRPEALAVMRDADAVSLLYDPEIPVNRLAAPNKYYEALMSGTPVLVSRGMELATEVARYDLGFVIRYDDDDELRAAMTALRDPGRRAHFRERCRRFFESECRLDRELERYRAFYLSILGHSGAGE